MNEIGARMGAIAGRTRRALGGGASLVAVLVAVGVLTWILAGRGSTSNPLPSSPAVAAGAEASAPAAGPSGSPGSNGESDIPSAAVTDSPTPSAAPTPTEAPTPRPTAAPTRQPATPRPTHDPAPEPTPWVGTASGTFGSTLSLEGVTVRLTQRAANTDPKIHCLSAEPSLQSYTEIVTFDLRIAWTHPADATEPFLGAGDTPYFNVIWWDPEPFQSGGDYVVSTCVRPGDTASALVQWGSNGGPPRMYRFTFH